MVERGSGHIVNIASVAAFTPTPVMAPYSVSKAGVKMPTECLRLELGPNGVGGSAICPGVINTNIGDPNLVARAAARAVRFDLAVVPVRTAAWLGHFMLRVAPGINRRMAQPFSVNTLEKLAARLLERFGDSKPLRALGADTDAELSTVRGK